MSLSHEVFLKHFRWLVKTEEILFYPKLFWERPEGSKHFGFESGDFIASEPKIFLKSRIADRTAFFFTNSLSVIAQSLAADCTANFTARRLLCWYSCFCANKERFMLGGSENDGNELAFLTKKKKKIVRNCARFD